MKLITPLWSDPVGWAEGVAKTKIRVCLFALVHVAFLAGGIWVTHRLVQKLPVDPVFSWLVIVPGGFAFAMIGVLVPAMYLYAIHRLLKMVGEATRDT